MAIIKIDGLITTSIAEASDILADGVSTTDFLPEGTNHLYHTDLRAVNAVEATSSLTLNSLRVDKGTTATTPQQAFANAAIQAVSSTNGVPVYSLRSTSNTSWEPAKWGTGLYELQFDADLTGANLDGTSQTIAFNIGDRNNSYNVAGLDSKIVNTVINANGDIESFNGEIEFRVNDKLNGGSNQYFPLRVASSGVTVTKGVPGTSSSPSFASAALRTVSDIGGLPLYALRVTDNTSYEPGPGSWDTGLYELKYDADLTGVNMNGSSQTISFNIADRNTSYSVSGIDTKIADTVIDTNGDIESFNGEIEFRVIDQSAGGSSKTSYPLRVASSGVTVSRDASTPQNWKSFMIEHDRSNGGGTVSDILWTAKTPNQTQNLGVLEMYTNGITTDANGDYTDFSTQFQFWTISKTAGAQSWHQLLTLDKDTINVKTSVLSENNSFTVLGTDYSDLLVSKRIEEDINNYTTTNTAIRVERTASSDLVGNTLEQFGNGFGADIAIALNERPISSITATSYNTTFDANNRPSFGVGQYAKWLVNLRGEGNDAFQGQPAVDAFELSPWENTVTINTATGTSNLQLTTNAPAIEETKPHVFVNITTIARDALTAESGMVIFNTTDIKLQCYDGTVWNNLH